MYDYCLLYTLRTVHPVTGAESCRSGLLVFRGALGGAGAGAGASTGCICRFQFPIGIREGSREPGSRLVLPVSQPCPMITESDALSLRYDPTGSLPLELLVRHPTRQKKCVSRKNETLSLLFAQHSLVWTPMPHQNWSPQIVKEKYNRQHECRLQFLE